MSYQSYVQTLLKDFGRIVGLEELALDENNYCCLVFDETYYVDLDYHEESGRLVFSCDLGKPDGQEIEAIYGRLLQVNYFWKEMAGVTMSLNSKTCHVFQILQLNVANIDFTKFQTALESFVNSAETWSKVLQMPASGAGAGAEMESAFVENEKADYEKKKYHITNMNMLA